MAAAIALSLCFLVFAPATSSNALEPDQIHLLLPSSGALEYPVEDKNCLSWRLAVETLNIRDWELVPEACAKYVSEYMLLSQYWRDCDAVVDVAIKYANTLHIPRDGKSVWVFDIDETAFSNLPFFARPSVAFGSKKINRTEFAEYIEEAEVPAHPATFRLYQTIIKLGIRPVFISETPDNFKEARQTNLKKAGYYQWQRLVLKPTAQSNTDNAEFKSMARTKLSRSGLRIVGNIGDQWSDITGDYPGKRTFKLPNPMYYKA